LATILVVDDEQDILEMTKIMLTASDHQVLTTLNGEDAIEIVQKQKVDLVLLDAVLPGINGLDVCRILRRNIKTKTLPIIMFSALGTGVKMMLDHNDRADGYVSKPFTRRLLLDTIDKALINKEANEIDSGNIELTNEITDIPAHMLSTAG
jgi:two-component system alkaline phosphatase synthesis response regulator PhoP